MKGEAIEVEDDATLLHNSFNRLNVQRKNWLAESILLKNNLVEIRDKEGKKDKELI